jgi:hypothetical protein
MAVQIKAYSLDFRQKLSRFMKTKKISTPTSQAVLCRIQGEKSHREIVPNSEKKNVLIVAQYH